MNKIQKAFAAVGFTAMAIVAGADLAWATPLTPAEEATGLFNSSKGQVLEVAKDMAPLVIGFGLVLFVIRKVSSSLSRAKAPRI